MFLIYGVKGAFDLEDAAAGNVGVALGGAEAGVAKEGLNIADVGAAFEEVCGEGMAQAVDRSFFSNSSAADGRIKYILGRPDRKVAVWGKSGK